MLSKAVRYGRLVLGSEEKKMSLSGQVRAGEVWDRDMDWGKRKMETAIGT